MYARVCMYTKCSRVRVSVRVCMLVYVCVCVHACVRVACVCVDGVGGYVNTSTEKNSKKRDQTNLFVLDHTLLSMHENFLSDLFQCFILNMNNNRNKEYQKRD